MTDYDISAYAVKHKNAFGAWVRDNGLDTGVACHKQTRSDAIWLSKRWDELIEVNFLELTYPCDIRQAGRNAGHRWAFGVDEPRAKKVGWIAAAEHAHIAKQGLRALI